MIARAAIVAGLLLVTAVAERTLAGAEARVDRQPLESLPYVLDGWHGARSAPLSRDVVALLGVDEHIFRTYVRDGIPANIYAGYYDSQRRGDTIHSPQNCLPGSGWQPIASAQREIRTARGAVRVNEYVIQKGIQQQVVLYWYHGRGRVIANEYANKAWLMWDAARRRCCRGSTG
jgi:EpsI family protein